MPNSNEMAVLFERYCKFRRNPATVLCAAALEHECWARPGARPGDHFLARDGSAFAELVVIVNLHNRRRATTGTRKQLAAAPYVLRE